MHLFLQFWKMHIFVDMCFLFNNSNSGVLCNKTLFQLFCTWHFGKVVSYLWCSEVKKCLILCRDIINVKWIKCLVKGYTNDKATNLVSGPGFRSPFELTEHLFLGLVATCWEHKVAHQTTQRPKHTVQTLQPGELTSHLPPAFSQYLLFSSVKLDLINTVSYLCLPKYNSDALNRDQWVIHKYDSPPFSFSFIMSHQHAFTAACHHN